MKGEDKLANQDYKMFQDELDLVYDTLRSKFKVNFKKPELFAGDEYEDRFFQASSLNDVYAIAYFIESITDEEKGRIFISDKIIYNRDSRIYAMFVGTARILMCELNNDLYNSNIDRLHRGRERRKEMDQVYSAFSNGMAHLMANIGCNGTKDETLIGKARYESEDAVDNLNEWLDCNMPSMSAIYHNMGYETLDKGQFPTRSIDGWHSVINKTNWKRYVPDWKKTVAIYLKRNEGILFEPGNNCRFGCYFAALMREEDIVKFIRNPPRTFEELLYPSKFEKRLNSSAP